MRDIVLALFIFGTIPFIFARPYIGLLVWSWIGYMSPHRLTYGFAYSFPWVMIIAIVTLVALAASKERKHLAGSAVTALLFAFLAWTLVTTTFSAMPAAAWEKWQEFAKVMIMVFVTLMVINTRERVHWLVWVIAISLGFYGIKGGLFTVLHGGNNHVLGPPGSFISDNNSLALALCMVIPMMRYLQLHSKRKWVRIGLGAGMLLTGVAVLGTYSRGGLIGLFIVGIALLVKGRRRFAVALTLVLIGSVAYHFMPPEWTARMSTLQDAKQTDSGETRIQSWKFATNVALHRPLVGGGFEAYSSAALWAAYAPPDSIQRAVHSIYFRTLGEQGFVGLAIFLGLLIGTWRNCSAVRRRCRDDANLKWAYDLASMLQVSLLAFMSSGTFLPMPYFDLALQMMAISCVLREHALNQSETRNAADQIGRDNTGGQPRHGRSDRALQAHA
jgi:probable O-glycosylation ligase (exosortase A-associated)